jgi:CDP-diacylglycerol--serine O-phosphatidyltransferase
MAKPKIKIGIYLLPNVLTTLGIFSGFFAIILAANGNYIGSAISIFFAMFWDGLDGRVARLTGTQTNFGAQYDTIADTISFCVAPALLIYFWTFSGLDKFTLISVFIYITAGALRLARFNAQAEVQDKIYFQGLPSPSAAAIVAGMVWVKEIMIGPDYSQLFLPISWFILISTGVLMVSNIRYYSFKENILKGKIPFKLLLLASLIIVFVIIWPSIILFSFFFCYALSGLIINIIQIRKKRKLKKNTKKS